MTPGGFSSSGLSVRLIILVVFAFALFMVSYRCHDTCPQNYEGRTAPALKNHQNSCPAHAEYKARGDGRRKTLSAKHKAAKLKLEQARGSRQKQPLAGLEATRSNAVMMDNEGQSVDIEMADGTSEASTSAAAAPFAFNSMDFDIAGNDQTAASSSTLRDSVAPLLVHPPNATPPASPEPISDGNAAGRLRREHRLPARFRDILPQPLPPVSDTGDDNEPPPQVLPRIRLIVRDTMRTAANSFGLWRQYQHRPSYDPDSSVPADDLANNFLGQPIPVANDVASAPVHPNKSVDLLLNWQNTGSNKKSHAEINRLVGVITDPAFSVDDFKGFKFDAARENHRLDKVFENSVEKSAHLEGFKEANIQIEVPSGMKDVPPKLFQVPSLQYRKLTTAIRAAFDSPLASQYHYSPFKLYHTSPITGVDERVYSEVYNSDAFIKEHDRVQRAPLPDDDKECTREKVVAALMFWSDSTHLANFGTANLWPIYLFLGNLSKYAREHPTNHACQHLAYLPKLPDSFQDFAATFHPKWGTQKKEILTHCRRELMHNIWRFLLDDDFLHAYQFGMVIKCQDGVERRVYPRIFTYSADYPEKVLIATIRDKGGCPCPRCFVTKDKLDKMGLKRDIQVRERTPRKYLANVVQKARKLIYEQGAKITGAAVERLLKPSSSVPTKNAFVDRLGEDFDIHSILVVDLMHEFELGVWKAFFTHLIRLLYAAQPNGKLVGELDERYRQIPTFGSTIRKFANNASEMKKLAARDFEDLLQQDSDVPQCSIPAFEGLLPEPYNGQLLKLLFRMAQWHALAKLRMHTESTLNQLEQTTTELGKLVRDFEKTTASAFNTTELPREAQARKRREKEKASTNTSQKRDKKLNLFIYKWHALPDYVKNIRLFGGADGFSTQLGELAHRLVKMLYGLTNKRKAEKQIAKRYIRMDRAKRAQHRHQLQAKKQHHSLSNIPISQNANEDAPEDNSDQRYFISPSRNTHFNIHSMLKERRDDPAVKDFLPKLQDHILGRLLGRDFDGDTHGTFTPADRVSVMIKGDKLFSVKTCRLFYTSYDVRRDSNTINPAICPDVMVKAPPPDNPSDTHDYEPYWYARVIGIYHATVATDHAAANGREEFQRMDFLWVRWFGAEPGYKHGFRRARLPKIGFVPSTDEFAFGFLDPRQVIRCCHLIPAFESGRTQELLPFPRSVGRLKQEDDDWTNYFVNVFLDRDMVIRQVGGGIGHMQEHMHPFDDAMDEDILVISDESGSESDSSPDGASVLEDISRASPSDEQDEDLEEEGGNEEVEVESEEADTSDDTQSSSSDDSDSDDDGYGSF